MNPTEIIIQQTKSWVERVVIGCNFCPFAGNAFEKKSIHFEVVYPETLEEALLPILQECQRLDRENSLETTLIIFPDHYADFDDYLELVELTEGMLTAHEYEGVYQVASFHPEYLFTGSDENDPANYTNRSPFPMIHILREESVTKAVDLYPDVESIPENNIAFAQEKGLTEMKALKDGTVN